MNNCIFISRRFPIFFFLSYLILYTSVRDINNLKLKRYYLKLLMYKKNNFAGGKKNSACGKKFRVS